MPIYDRPTKAIMRDFAEQRLKPTDIFEKREAVNWFKQNYPRIKSNTVGMHVEGMATNSPYRKHHPNIKPGSGYDLFYKIGPGRFRLWDPSSDPAPIYRDDILRNEQDENVDGALEPDDQVDQELEVSVASREFAYEKDLQNYLSQNLNILREGLSLYEDEDHEFKGIEFPAGGRYIDILATDKSGDFVVIELKVSRGYDRVIGQLLRYMAWVKANLAGDKNVRGAIVASEITDDLKMAASLIPDVELWQYEISFQLKRHLGNSDNPEPL